MANRPSFNSMWNNYTKINISVKDVVKKIGGKVEEEIQGITANDVCAIRMSYALNQAGVLITKNDSHWKTLAGADKNLYIYRAGDMAKFLHERFGKADLATDFADKKGILLFNITGSDNASGHVTLWNGKTDIDRVYFAKSTGARLWILR